MLSGQALTSGQVTDLENLVRNLDNEQRSISGLPVVARHEVIGLIGPVSGRTDAVARVMDAKWVQKGDVWVLTRDQKADQALQKAWLAEQERRLAEWKRANPAPRVNRIATDARARTVKEQFDSAYRAQADSQVGYRALQALGKITGAGVLLSRLLQVMDTGTLLSACRSKTLVFSDRPNRAELPIPSGAIPAIADFQDERDAFAAIQPDIKLDDDLGRKGAWQSLVGNGGPIRPYGKLIFTLQRSGSRLYSLVTIFDTSGGLITQAGTLVPILATVKPTPTEEGVLNRLGSADVKWSPAAIALRDAKADPRSDANGTTLAMLATQEPVEAICGDALRAISETLKMPVVARLPDEAVGILPKAGEDRQRLGDWMRKLITDGIVRLDVDGGTLYIKPAFSTASEESRLDRLSLQYFVKRWHEEGPDLRTLAKFHANGGWPATLTIGREAEDLSRWRATDFSHHLFPHSGLAFLGALSDSQYAAMFSAQGLSGRALDPEQKQLLVDWGARRAERWPDAESKVPDQMLHITECIPDGFANAVIRAIPHEVSVIQATSTPADARLRDFPSGPTPAESVAGTIVLSYGRGAAEDPLAYLEGEYVEWKTPHLQVVVQLTADLALTGTFEVSTKAPAGARPLKVGELSEGFLKELREAAVRTAKEGG